MCLGEVTQLLQAAALSFFQICVFIYFYLFLAVLGLHRHMGFLWLPRVGAVLFVVCGLLTEVASLTEDHGL